MCGIRLYQTFGQFLGMYYVASLFMVCLATSINVITLNIYRNSVANQGERVPRWMQKYILGYLASFMRMPIYQPDSIALLKTSQVKFWNSGSF